MSDVNSEPKLLLPALAPLYRQVVPLSWLVVRCTAGLILFYHGTLKIGHLDDVTANMVKNGIIFPPAIAAYIVTLTETVGAFCVALGLFTRFFAAACAFDLAVITFHVLWPKGIRLVQRRLRIHADVGADHVRYRVARRGSLFGRPLAGPRTLISRAAQRRPI